MTRAERAAEKAYPPQVVKTLHGEFDCNAYARLLFWRGYRQALVETLVEAVEGEVTTDNRGNKVVRAGVFNKDFEYGDKVRIVVLKAEEEL